MSVFFFFGRFLHAQCGRLAPRGWGLGWMSEGSVRDVGHDRAVEGRKCTNQILAVSLLDGTPQHALYSHPMRMANRRQATAAKGKGHFWCWDCDYLQFWFLRLPITIIQKVDSSRTKKLSTAACVRGGTRFLGAGRIWKWVSISILDTIFPMRDSMKIFHWSSGPNKCVKPRPICFSAQSKAKDARSKQKKKQKKEVKDVPLIKKLSIPLVIIWDRPKAFHMP